MRPAQEIKARNVPVEIVVVRGWSPENTMYLTTRHGFRFRSAKNSLDAHPAYTNEAAAIPLCNPVAITANGFPQAFVRATPARLLDGPTLSARRHDSDPAL